VFRETVGDTTGSRGAASRPLAGGALVLGHDDTASDVRLRRSDLDQFERGLRRRRAVVWLAVLAILGGGAGAGAWYLTRPPGVLSAELEPNNDPAHANPIAAGTVVQGLLGKRVSANEGDRDSYRIAWPSGERRVVTVEVSGVPNLDIKLGVSDGDGLHGATVDAGRLGEGEILHRVGVDGSIVITVGQTVASGQYPVENVSDHYELKVIEERAEAGEIEPNNLTADATPLAPSHELVGYLDSRGDVDLLRWTGATGKYAIVVRGDGLPLQWRIGDGSPRTPGAATLELEHGDLIRIERGDRAASGHPLPGRDAPWSIVVVAGR
jgi:hypothetical protein